MVFRCKQYPDAELVQASGMPVRFQQNGRITLGIVLPARVLAGRVVMELIIIGAATDMRPAVLWHLKRRTTRRGLYEFAPLKKGVNYVICPRYKPNKLYTKDRDWAVVILPPDLVSNEVTLQDGSVVTYHVAGAQGFFHFADPPNALGGASALAACSGAGHLQDSGV